LKKEKFGYTRQLSIAGATGYWLPVAEEKLTVRPAYWPIQWNFFFGLGEGLGMGGFGDVRQIVIYCWAIYRL
jgi:hypothetical protein